MNPAGKQLLTSPRFTLQEHGGERTRGDLLREADGVTNRGRFAHDVRERTMDDLLLAFV
jgi:hypothetical protein